MIRLETFLESWKTIRQDTAQAVEDLPPGDLDFKPAPELMTFREIATHILTAGHGLTGLLLEGVENFQAPDFREMLKKHVPALDATASAVTIAAELRKSMDLRLGQLAVQTPGFFAQIITNMYGLQVTRLEMLQFVKEHELMHRSQLFLYLRLRGVVPATTRRRQAKK